MEKLTLENIVPYLPYGLKAKGTDDTIYHVLGAYDEMGVGKGKNLMPLYNHQYGRVLIDYTERFGYDFKPILRPIDLTKPIMVEGKEVIPVVELAKIAIPNPSEEAFGGMNWFEYEGEAVLYDTGMESGYLLKYVNGCFILEGHDYPAYCPDQLDLFQWLFKHNFDVFGLIPLGLAIDVNTLETNPYI